MDPCGMCIDCVQDLERFQEPVCWRCSTPTRGGEAAPDCPVCRDQRWAFERVIALGAYDGLLRQLVLEAKLPAGAAGAAALGRLLARQCAPPDEAAVVATVPQHWRRRLWRRADGVAALADALADGWRLRRGSPLRRTRATRRQTEIAPSDRAANVRGAFAAFRPGAIEGATVVLVDDVFTTGSTCHAAAKVLRSAGAERVIVAVAARRVGRL
jgi:predicted amidophosphoribosyltransferase